MSSHARGAVPGVATRRQVRQDRRDAAVRPIIHRALDDGEVDWKAVGALDPRLQRVLDARASSLLPNLRGEDRWALARLLQQRGVIDTARRETRSRRATSRARAGVFLGDAGAVEALPELLTLLRDRDPEVRWAAARGLGRLGDPAGVSALLSSLEGRHPLPVDVVADAVFEIRDCPRAVLRQGLRSRSVPTRALAAELLGRFQAVSATAELTDVLRHDPSFEVRARAARSLGRIGSPRAVEPLLACLEEGPAAVRAQAVWALGHLGAAEAVPALRDLLVDPTHRLSDQAAQALAAIAPLGVAVLTQEAESHGSAGRSARQALECKVV